MNIIGFGRLVRDLSILFAGLCVWLWWDGHEKHWALLFCLFLFTGFVGVLFSTTVKDKR